MDRECDNFCKARVTKIVGRYVKIAVERKEGSRIQGFEGSRVQEKGLQYLHLNPVFK